METLGSEPAKSTQLIATRTLHRAGGQAPRICSLFAAFVAAAVLAGWSTHTYALVTVLPNFPAMAQSTAAAFLLASASLWLQQGGLLPGKPRGAALVLALATVLFGLITLLRYSLSLLGHGVSLSGGSGHPINQMSPNTALNFVILGAALLFADVRGAGERWPAQALALVVALDALTALIGQFYSITFLYGLSHFLGMAVHTACLFLALAAGLLLARPDRGFMAILLADDAAGRAARRSLPLALIAPIVLGGVGLLGQRLHNSAAPLLSYLLVVASIGLLGWLVWGNVLALAAQVRRSQAAERQVADLERGRVEDALAASEQRLLFAVEGAGIGTWRWDISTDDLTWSPLQGTVRSEA
jgi:PAS domain-containing protein